MKWDESGQSLGLYGLLIYKDSYVRFSTATIRVRIPSRPKFFALDISLSLTLAFFLEKRPIANGRDVFCAEDFHAISLQYQNEIF